MGVNVGCPIAVIFFPPALIYFFRISLLCREPVPVCTFAIVLLLPFAFPNDCTPDLELAMGLEPATC